MVNERKELSHKREISWFKVLIQLQAAFILVVGIPICIFQAHWRTLIFTSFLIILGNLGLTAGAHRLWAHKTYKAALRLRIFLMLCHTLAGTGSIYSWVRLHRLHHKHHGTDLDPFNPNKGFFYAHVNSFYLDLSEAQEEALKKINMDDLEEDGVVMFQHKFYWILFVIWTVLLPMNAPAEYWGETVMNAFAIAACMRVSITLHSNLLIHSANKLLGLAPGEKFPSDTNLVFLFNKTFWISYHYLAPWDYQTGEYGKYGEDFATLFIKACGAIGLASDLKTIDSNTVRSALVKSVDEKKSIALSLYELQLAEEKKREHIFKPTKFL